MCQWYTICVIVSGYTIVSWSFLVVQTFFHFFHCLKFFLLLFIFHHWKFPENHWNFPQMYTIVWFVWRVHYCVLLLPEVMIFWFFSIISFTFSFAKVFSFNYLIPFLVSFIWNSQKCPVSQNIWCLIKTQLKHITQTIFQGGSPWATWYTIVLFVWGYTIVSCCFLRSWFFDFFNHFLYLFLC